MAARTEEIIAYLDELLGVRGFPDMGPNGLQVPGSPTVTTVVTGVSGQLELFERAVELGAQLVIVHHGILWDFEPRRIGAAQAKRLKTLLANDVALAGYHLPLDAHPEVGNNALIAAGLGADVVEPAFDHKGRTIGVIAHFDDNGGDGIPASELFARVATLTDRDPLVFDAGPAFVRRLGIVSGSAANDLATAIDLGLDAFMTGEPKEHVMAQARENFIHFIAAGHYATETFGIRRIGELVAERFGVAHHFVDLPNPV
ncbi:Nif3-like dinuclear metal center hexameric protein [Conexibacter arvalis]|uniref:GTP cyclohydrolase 1 type 2 homolog n=1 Tax=Conexibacter arvalis TaxID=912552 RepID=A0A840IG24_9ACTN|nr:Nif3-like dinuclear metal center hexameric protein [Conexibacter arvalis]MBB4662890.1 dinuclear metal center YbgI/SA1388 family protein [Conexibacter arvalis]